MHADFYSRLAMTFDHGEYSGIEVLGDRTKIAEKLYRKSLEYHPVPRAFLGLGMIRQKKREFAESIEVLSEGVKHFPDDEQINICLGISYMNLGREFIKRQNQKG